MSVVFRPLSFFVTLIDFIMVFFYFFPLSLTILQRLPVSLLHSEPENHKPNLLQDKWLKISEDFSRCQSQKRLNLTSAVSPTSHPPPPRLTPIRGRVPAKRHGGLLTSGGRHYGCPLCPQHLPTGLGISLSLIFSLSRCQASLQSLFPVSLQVVTSSERRTRDRDKGVGTIFV